MATSTSYSCAIKLIAYDNSYIGDPVSTNTIVDYDFTTITPIESRNQCGLLNEVEHSISRYHGDIELIGIKRPTPDSQFSPLISEGDLQLGYDFHKVLSGNTISEVFNQTSILFPYETAFRHISEYTINELKNIHIAIYQRDQDLNITTPIVFNHVPYFTQFPESPLLIEDNGGITWSTVDRSVPEFMIDNGEIVLNQNPDSYFNNIPAFAHSTSTSDLLGVVKEFRYGSDQYTLYTQEYPCIVDNLYQYDGTNIIQWTSTSALSGLSGSDNYYSTFSTALGEIKLNPAHTSIEGGFFYSATTLPLVTYSHKSQFNKSQYLAEECTLERKPSLLGDSIFVVATKNYNYDDIQLEIEIDSLSENSSLTWSTSYYGYPAFKVKVTAYDKQSNNTIPNIPIKLESLNGIGLIDSQSESTRYTNSQGFVEYWYKPPSLNQILTTDWSRDGSDNTQINSTTSNNSFLLEPSEIYTYLIRKDDPLIGRVDDPSNPDGTRIWDANLLNGRKVLLYVWDAIAINPVTGNNGAFVPYRPYLIGANYLKFNSEVPLAEPANDSNWIGGYAVGGPKQAILQASTIGMNTGTSTFKINIKLSSLDKGEVVVQNTVYPFGWRLPGEISAASRLGGALFLTINPVAGSYDILFETSGTFKQMASGLGFYVDVTV